MLVPLLAAWLAVPAAAVPARPAPTVSATFTSTPAPLDDAGRASVQTASHLVLKDASGKTTDVPLQWHALYRSGDDVGGGRAGLIVDEHGAAVARSAPDSAGRTARGPFYARSPDGTTMLQVPGKKGEPAGLALVTHFEYHTEGLSDPDGHDMVQLYQLLPMILDVARLTQDSRTGMLTARSIEPVDLTGCHGVWTPCNASLTPWNTHLGSEEYEPDARYYENRPLEPMNLWSGTPHLTAREGGANAYDYGHPVEVRLLPDGRARGEKRLALGRISFELECVMPDGRTLLAGDDAHGGVRFMFVADKPNDLRAGTLYAGRWIQEVADGFGTARLEWIRLGHATESEIARALSSGIGFSDIFDALDPAEYAAHPEAHPGFALIECYHGTPGAPALECLRVRPGRETEAAFLESRRTAALRGATAEFTKMEGLAMSAAHRLLFTVISHANGPMLASAKHAVAANDIALTGNVQDLQCGAVYASTLAGGVRDTAGQPIDSDWVPLDMRPFVTGARNPSDDPGERGLEACDPERISGPDNLAVSEALDTLFIGEDTEDHVANALWAVPLSGGAPVRILTVPVGAEVTGLRAVDDANGWSYLTVNVQHPGATSELARYPADFRQRMWKAIDPRGAVGYLGPWRLPSAADQAPRAAAPAHEAAKGGRARSRR